MGGCRQTPAEEDRMNHRMLAVTIAILLQALPLAAQELAPNAGDGGIRPGIEPGDDILPEGGGWPQPEGGGDPQPLEDTVPPSNTMDLTVTLERGMIVARWTSSGDDGMSGTPASYVIWAADQATGITYEFSDAPAPVLGWTPLEVVLDGSGLPTSTYLQFGVGTWDEQGWLSGSN